MRPATLGVCASPGCAIPQTDHRDPTLEQKKQALKVLTRNIDTGTPEGRLFFHITRLR